MLAKTRILVVKGVRSVKEMELQVELRGFIIPVVTAGIDTNEQQEFNAQQSSQDLIHC